MYLITPRVVEMTNVWRGANTQLKTQRKQNLCCLPSIISSCRRGSLSSSYRSSQKIETRPDVSTNVRFFTLFYIPLSTVSFALRRPSTVRVYENDLPGIEVAPYPKALCAVLILIVTKHAAHVYSTTVVINGVGCFKPMAETTPPSQQLQWWVCGGKS